jgi:hypothetical protein
MKRTRETKKIERIIDERYPNCPKEVPRAYRYNSASLRIRVVDERFKGLNRSQREKIVMPLIRTLPEETQQDVMVLLILAPDELNDSLMNREYEHPSGSDL